MNSYRYTTDVDGGNDVERIDITFKAASETEAWRWADKLMTQIGIKANDRVNPKIARKG